MLIAVRGSVQAILVAAALTGCEPAEQRTRGDGTTMATSGWATACPIPPDAPRAPLGLTDAALRDRYGPPIATDTFILGQAIDPVRMSVRNTLSAPADLRRQVREMRWQADGCELRVWLVQRGDTWRAVHTMRSPAGGEH